MSLGPGCIVTVCRDCCCGTTQKHPNVDHDAQLAALRRADGITVRVSRCLAACELSNMVVVNPSPAGREAGGRPAWLGGVLSDAEIDLIVGWVDAGGPGVAPAPPSLTGNLEAVQQLMARVVAEA